LNKRKQKARAQIAALQTIRHHPVASLLASDPGDPILFEPNPNWVARTSLPARPGDDDIL
jgi:hypothetical protein